MVHTVYMYKCVSACLMLTAKHWAAGPGGLGCSCQSHDINASVSRSYDVSRQRRHSWGSDVVLSPTLHCRQLLAGISASRVDTRHAGSCVRQHTTGGEPWGRLRAECNPRRQSWRPRDTRHARVDCCGRGQFHASGSPVWQHSVLWIGTDCLHTWCSVWLGLFSVIECVFSFLIIQH